MPSPTLGFGPGGQWILGPGVLGVAGTQVLADLEVSGRPEAPQVVGDLDGAEVRPQRCRTTATRPPATRGVSLQPNSSWTWTASTGGWSGAYERRIRLPLGTSSVSGACSSRIQFWACVSRDFKMGTSATRLTSSSERLAAQTSFITSPRTSGPNSGHSSSGIARAGTPDGPTTSRRPHPPGEAAPRSRNAAASIRDASTGSTRALRSSRTARSRYQSVLTPTIRWRSASNRTALASD